MKKTYFATSTYSFARVNRLKAKQVSLPLIGHPLSTTMCEYKTPYTATKLWPSTRQQCKENEFIINANVDDAIFIVGGCIW